MFESVLVAACDELLGSGKSAAQVAAALSNPQEMESANRRSVRSLFTRGVEGVLCNEAVIQSVLESLIGKSSSGGTLTATGSGGGRIYSVV